MFILRRIGEINMKNLINELNKIKRIEVLQFSYVKRLYLSWLSKRDLFYLEQGNIITSSYLEFIYNDVLRYQNEVLIHIQTRYQNIIEKILTSQNDIYNQQKNFELKLIDGQELISNNDCRVRKNIRDNISSSEKEKRIKNITNEITINLYKFQTECEQADYFINTRIDKVNSILYKCYLKEIYKNKEFINAKLKTELLRSDICIQLFNQLKKNGVILNDK